MDFFQQQDKARKKTKLLVFYFACAVLLIIAMVYFVALAVFTPLQMQHTYYNDLNTGNLNQVHYSLWNLKVFLGASLITLAIVSLGSLFKISQLAGGGGAVAETLGGRLVNSNTADPNERKLLNVVEEMSIASGVPMPKVYVLDEERGINAFAAGHAPGDAAIGVTRGGVTLLSRDQLQGVIGHEFSHLLNGDMRLNIQLIGILFGILCLATVGRIFLYTRGGGRNNNAGPIIGLALILIGSIGVFFGRLIQAAVSRQREFLADASSVQFTRNPLGLSGALQKIGRYSFGSRMDSEHAPDACHMFFGNGVRDPIFTLMATHPPIEDRIRAIDPTWDGKFPPLPDDEKDVVKRAAFADLERPPSSFPPIFGMPGGMVGAAIIASGVENPPVIKSHSVLPNLGNPTPLHLKYAVQLRNSMPENLKAAAREPLTAIAVIYAMLLSDDEKERAAQLSDLSQRVPQSVSAETVALFPDVSKVAAHAHLPLVNIAIGALRHLSEDQFAQFSETLQWLIDSDGKTELFEFVLQKIVLRHLAPQFTKERPPVAQFYTLKPLLPDCVVLLSALANVGSSDAAEIKRAFETGAPFLRAKDNANLQLLPKEQCGVNEMDDALNRLALAVPVIKKNLIEACVHTVGADGVIQESEAELLRAIADTLDCPMPPFVNVE
ncbi:MAG: M48 family metallopeptidase [Limisphaerales bacterium]